eukprot:CAMPEP_0118978076 /NCGR_PEP_ID=MMETSP1173-20130426/22829_1 /TAXON_ID=1034831 /ORGANISM="Rhizochromulina marina cf, Strain CCMP1243" /LENGTH=655 /DNA_ID=CAMNT_0006928241 /DNA_START=136 /DNA_END=2099 /DNA_ORIENTATION=+
MPGLKAKPAFNDAANMPEEMRMETLPRNLLRATFDNCVLSLVLEAGKGNKNAVLVGWKDPIRDHDAQVLEVERLLDKAIERERGYKKQLRTYRNWETAWLLMNTKPDELDEYVDLKNQMKDFETQLKFISSVEEKIELQDKWTRFHELEGRCEKLLAAQRMLARAKEARDEAFKAQLAAGRELDEAKEKERALADQISEDQVEADSRGVGISELFPNISPGFIVTRVNRSATENLDFPDILTVIEESKPPHELEFRRYDYRQNMLSGRWESLQELRAQGKFVEDPRVKQQLFVDAGRRGDVVDLDRSLVRGMNVDASDQSQCTAFHHACANGHFEAMQLLLSKGAAIDVRDGNLETPLIQASRRGQEAVVKWLLDKGASVDARDRLLRTPVFHAILSTHINLVCTLLDRRTSLTVTDKHWKWTPLHYAASVGSEELVELLLSRRASPYAVSENGWTPLRCAQENSCTGCADLITEFVFNEPGQCVLPANERFKSSVWLGSHRAADVRWATDRGFGAMLAIYAPRRRDPKHHWLQVEDHEIDVFQVEISAPDDAEGPEAWGVVLRHLPRMLGFIDKCLAQGRELLIHDATGVSTGAGVVLAHALVKRRVRFEAALEHITAIRRQVKLSPSVRVGLEDLQEELDQRKLERLENRLRT